MSWSELLLFVHVTMAVVWVGGGLMVQFFALRATMSGDPARTATFGEDVKWIADRVFVPGSLLAFVSGVLLVVDSDFYGFGDDWIVIGLALYATTFLAGLLFLGPEAARVGRLTAEGSPAAGPRMQRLLLLSRLDLALLFLIVYDMTVKPSFDDASSMLWGLAGAVVIAALLVWRYRVALSQPPPSPSTAG